MTAGLALITGASCGVGFALAEQFARHGYDLVISDAYDEIHTAAAALTVLGTDVQAEQVDLCCADNAELLDKRVLDMHRPVTAAALTASVNDALALDGTLDGALRVVDSNVRGTTLLARLQAGHMAAHGRGGIILTASPEDWMPGLSTAVYSASSAFLRAFAEILQDEFSNFGVSITAMMPEPIAADQGGFTDMLFTLVGRPSSNAAADVARLAFETLTCDETRGIAAWAAEAVTSLAGRLFADRIKGPVRQIISPTGEAV